MSFVQETEAQTASSPLRITAEDYSTVVNQVFGEASIAYIVLEDSSKDLTDQRDLVKDVEVTSESGSTVFVDLLETGPRTGLFYGGVGFATGTSEKFQDPGDPFFGKIGADNKHSKVKVARGNEVKVTVGTMTTSFDWFDSHPGLFSGSGVSDTAVPTEKEITGHKATVVFKVEDADLNADITKVDTHDGLVWVFTDSDIVGEPVRLVEQGTSSSTFMGSIGFESSILPDNGKVMVKAGDRVRAIYSETAGADGRPEVHDLPGTGTWSFKSLSTSLNIFFDRTTYFGASAPSVDPLAPADRAGIVLTDLDQDVGFDQDEVTVTVTSDDGSNPPDTATIKLRETGARSGTFFEQVTFSHAAGDKGGGAPLYVDPARPTTLRVTYTDTDADGQHRTRTNTAQWRPADTGSLSLASGDEVLNGTQRLFNIELTDADADRTTGTDSATVQVRSSSAPTGGIPVTLSESVTNPGTFSGTFQMTTGTESGRLKVADGDGIIVEYADAVNDSGRPEVIRTNEAVWRMAVDATIATDAMMYYHHGKATAPSNTSAEIVVVDHDEDDPRVRDSIDVTVVDATASATNTKVTLKETGIDTGVFRGLLIFDPAAAATNTDGRLKVAADGLTRFTIEYLEAADATGQPRLVTHSGLEFWEGPNTAVVRVEREADTPRGKEWRPADFIAVPPPAGGSAQVVLYTTGAGPFTAVATSTQCPGDQVTINLVNTGKSQDVHRWFGKLDVQKDTCGSTTKLGISDGATISVRVNNAAATTGTAKARAADTTTVAFTEKDGTTNVNRAAGDMRPITLKITHTRSNGHSGAHESIPIELQGRATGAKTQLWLSETGPNTGVFTGSFLATDDHAFDTTTPAKNATRNATHTVFLDVDFPAGTTSDYLAGYGGGIFDSLEASFNTKKDTVEWWPGKDASLTVIADAVGTGAPVKVRLVDPDLLAERVFKEKTDTASNKREFSFTKGIAVRGSELVFVNITVTSTSSTSTTFREVDGRPAEPIADRNGDRIVDCRDVTITVNTGSVTCTSVVGNRINLNQVSCGNGITGGQCTFTVNYWYRADATNAVANSHLSYVLKEDGTGVRFNAAPPTGGAVLIDYTPATRTIVARGAGAAENVKVSHTGAGTFVSDIPTASTSADDGKIDVTGQRTPLVFSYGDPAPRTGVASGSDPAHMRAERADGLWRSAESAQVRFMKPDYSATASNPYAGRFVALEVIDRDSDRTDRQDKIQVTVLDAQNTAEKETVTLVETSSGTGVFRGVVEVAVGASTTGDGTLQFAGSSRLLRVNYQDPFSASGVANVARTATISWQPAVDAHITLCSAPELDGAGRCVATKAATLASPIVGTTGALYVVVDDKDADRNPSAVDTVTVRVVSDADPTGEIVSATETGPASGVFVSSAVRFETQRAVGNGKVVAIDRGTSGGDWLGDRVWAVYTDLLDGKGNQRAIPSYETDNADADHGRTGWDRTFDGVVTFERPFYIGTTPGTVGHIARANFTVADGDLNVDSRTVNVVTLAPTGDLKIGPMKSDGSGIDDTRGALPARLIETGANTGIFIGQIGFDTAKTSDVAGNTPAKIKVSNLDKVRALYNDTTLGASGEVPTQPFFAETTWYAAGFGVVTFDRAGYNAAGQEPVVRLFDSQLAGATSVSVQVASTRSPTGLSLTMTEIDRNTGLAKKGTGVFEASFDLTTGTPGSGELRVDPEDTLEARYQDADPPGTRTAQAAVGVGDDEAPVTSLVTDPATAAGKNGWFLQKPVVSFEADEAVLETRYSLDGGAALPFDGPIEITEGTHEIEFWSVDFFGNEEEPQTEEVNVDLTNPTQSVAGLKATPRAAGAIELAWDPVTDKTPLEWGGYRVFRGSVSESTEVGNVSTESFTDTPESDANYTYFVVVEDASGRYDASLSKQVFGISDRVAPTLTKAGALQTEIREEEDALRADLYASLDTLPSDFDKVIVKVTAPAGGNSTEITLTRVGTSLPANFTGAYTGFTATGTYSFAIEALDKAGNADTKVISVKFIGIDKTPPVFNVPATVEQGKNLVATLVDNDSGVVSAKYKLGSGDFITVDIPSATTSKTVTIATAGLALGEYTITWEATDLNGNKGQGTATFEVVEPGTTPPTPGKPTIVLIDPTPSYPYLESGGTASFRVESASPLSALSVKVGDAAPADLLAQWISSTAAIELPTTGLAPGVHVVTVSASNAAGDSSVELSVTVLEPGLPLPAKDVRVSQVPGTTHLKVDWEPSPSDNVDGYLIHRSSSPFKVIAVVGPDVTSYVDDTTKAGVTYIYQVTAFSSEKGLLEEGAESDLLVLQFAETQSSPAKVIATGADDDGFFASYWWVFLILLGVLIAVSMVYVYRDRLFGSRQEAEEEDLWADHGDASGAFAGEDDEALAAQFGVTTHDVRCPKCTTEFSVSGEKPIVTNCPNCGGTGYRGRVAIAE
ncbi:MAG: fibronectin type III domain-containing protein, partial [Euryarchaeota archaeon]|nr:fibronectin type III domain-containing protein [Euryarchaeota archaeon]